MPVPVTVDWLVNALERAKPVVHCRILLAIENVQASSEKFGKTLIASLDHSDRRVRRTAADILKRVACDPRLAIPALVRHSFERDEAIRIRAAEALIKQANDLPEDQQRQSFKPAIVAVRWREVLNENCDADADRPLWRPRSLSSRRPVQSCFREHDSEHHVGRCSYARQSVGKPTRPPSGDGSYICDGSYIRRPEATFRSA